MISNGFYKKYYPDDSLDGTKEFYSWINKYLSEDLILLNLGAGPATENETRMFKAKVRHVIGADIDPIVLNNPELDEAVIIKDGVIPIDDESINIVVSDFVLEHVENPVKFMKEVHRVLCNGGVFFFRTPNMYHYVALGASITPHWVHQLVANPMRGLSKDAHEPWKTQYRMNTRKTLIKLAKQVGFNNVELRMIEAQPSYLVFNSLAFLLGVGYERTVNKFESLECFRACIFGKMKK
jgi:SAM-dependent methyltransferase